MQPVSTLDAPLATTSATHARSVRSATRRRRLVRVAVFGGSVMAALAVATPAMAWPAMGC